MHEKMNKYVLGGYVFVLHFINTTYLGLLVKSGSDGYIDK